MLDTDMTLRQSLTQRLEQLQRERDTLTSRIQALDEQRNALVTQLVQCQGATTCLEELLHAPAANGAGVPG
jgi:predicted  nucleic acid-binding Zn-ribbon protein